MRESSFPGPVPVGPPRGPVARPPRLPGPRPRDRRIDVMRGLALAMIFVDHVPGTLFEHLTLRNFGFADAAEIFVFLSGVSAALAYARLFQGPLWPATARVWRRAWTIYCVQVLVTVWVLAIAAGLDRFAGNAALIGGDNMEVLQDDLIGVLIGLPVMLHQLGYVNILPLYAALLMVTPALIPAAARFPGLTLAGSAALWLAAGLSGLQLPSYPTDNGWFLNPLAWQFLFVIGLLTGLRLKQGRRLVPRSPLLLVAAWAVVIGVVLWLKVPVILDAGNAWLRGLLDQGVPELFVGFVKSDLPLPRLLHALALIYLAATLPWVRRLCDSPRVEYLAVLGRHALPVFAMGTVLSFLGRAARELTPPSLLFDAALLAAGLLTLVLFAMSLDQSRAARAGVSEMRDRAPIR